MIKRALVLWLIAASAWAGSGPGSPVTRGNFLLIPSYQTTAALNLFVDGSAGSDTNPCTASGASACATIQAAYNKIPKLVRHPVNVTVATGNYVGAYLMDYGFDPVSLTNGAYIQTTGTLITATISTGSATGTATAGTAGSTTTFGTLTDSGQTWTVNNLAGFIIEITGGTGSGQTRIIHSNTATAITIEGTWTAPTGTSTYAVRDWGAVITTAINQPAVGGAAAGAPAGLIIAGAQISRLVALAGGNYYFDRMKSAPAGAASIGASAGTGTTYFNESRLNGSTTAAGLRSDTSASVNVIDSYISSGTSVAIRFDANGTSTLTTGVLNVQRSEITSASTSQVLALGGTVLLTSSSLGSTSSSTTSIVAMSNTNVSRVSTCNITCTAGGSTVGLFNQSSATNGSYSSITIDANTYTACPIGIELIGPSQITAITAQTLTGPVGGTAIIALRGGHIELQIDPVVSTYGTELNVDGITSTVSAWSALTPVSIYNINYGSFIGR